MVLFECFNNYLRQNIWLYFLCFIFIGEILFLMFFNKCYDKQESYITNLLGLKSTFILLGFIIFHLFFYIDEILLGLYYVLINKIVLTVLLFIILAFLFLYSNYKIGKILIKNRRIKK
jgi:hypothetical protein